MLFRHSNCNALLLELYSGIRVGETDIIILITILENNVSGDGWLDIRFKGYLSRSVGGWGSLTTRRSHFFNIERVL